MAVDAERDRRDAAAAAAGAARLVGCCPPTAASLPAIVLLGGFFFVPLGIIVAYSFWQDENYTVVHNWTTENYRYFFSVSAYVDTMWATLWVAASAPRSRSASRSRSPTGCRATCRGGCGAPLLVLVVVPFWTSYLLRVYSWITILGDKGLLNRFLEWTGITSGPVSAVPLRPRRP